MRKNRAYQGNFLRLLQKCYFLLQETIAVAATQGAKRLITVSPVGVERLLAKAGFHAHRAGPPMIVDGHPIFACWIETDTL